MIIDESLHMVVIIKTNNRYVCMHAFNVLLSSCLLFLDFESN